MRAAWKSIVALWVVCMGFAVAFLTVSAPKDTMAETAGVTLVQGRADSNVEVYVITDWFCPACQRVEPEINKSFQAMSREARVIFIDMAMHPETYNYMPYNISFAVNEKPKYIELRKALLDLARKNIKNPTAKDVQDAITPLGVKYRELPQMDIMAAIRYFEGAVKILGIDSTPTVLVLNKKTKNYRKLTGTDGITYDKMLSAVREVSAG